MNDQGLILTDRPTDEAMTKIEQAKKMFVGCQKCGGLRFNQIFILKKVTPLDDPQLTENMVQPIPIFQCKKCGAIANIG